MKILHLSEYSLPHRRIEKSAITGLNHGYRLFFAGTSSNGYNDSKIFEKRYTLQWPTTNYNKGLLFPYIVLGKTSIWNSLKKQIKKILEEIRPDIVHAHNLLCAKLISEFNVPMIYNDHEYWSNYVKFKNESKRLRNNNIFSNKIKNVLHNRIINIWSKWESDIISKYPTLVVSNTILSEMKKKYSNEIFLLPNFPLKIESPMLDNPEIHTDLNCVYAGIEQFKVPSIHRNITGLDRVFNENDVGKLILMGRTNFKSTEKVICKGLLSRNDMYTEMVKYSIGLIPWKRHWSHRYFNPNKAFEYAHSGLYIVCTSSLSDVVATLGNNCTTIEDYDDLVTQLSYFRDNIGELYKKRVKILRFAKDNLLWEKYDKNIIEAYKSI